MTSVLPVPKVVSKRPVPSYGPYLNAIQPASNDLRALAFTKTQPCRAGDKTCAAVRLYHFVQKDLGYLSDPVAREHIQPPETTLKIGAGDCEDLSILLSSLLENVGIPTYLVFTDTHAYVLACEVESDKLISTVEQVYTTVPGERSFEETKWIDPHTVVTWTVNSPLRRVRSILDASEPIDWLVVPTAADAEAAPKGQPYQHYANCSRQQVLRLDLECELSGAVHTLAWNRSNQGVRVSVTLQYQGQPVPPRLPASFQTYDINGSRCITFDPSIKGEAYPGQVMPAVVTAPQRLAVSRTGHQVRLN